MADLATTLPDRLELGAVRREDWATQITTTDDGTEVRNNRWSAPLRTYEINFPVTTRADEDYTALRALFAEAEGSRYSFPFLDWSDGETVDVRFDAPLQIAGLAAHLDQIVACSLVEVRDYPFEGDPLPDPAPVYIASGTYIALNSTSSLNIPYPAGLAADDIAVTQLTVFDALTGGGGWNTPAGWNPLHNGIVDGDTKRQHYLFWRRLTGSETGTQTFTTFGGMGGGSSDSCNGRMSIFRGCIASGDPFDMADDTEGGNDTSPNAPQINAYGKNRLICNFWAMQFPGANFQAGANYTEIYDVSSTTGVDTGLMLTTREVVQPVTYPGETASIGANATMGQSCIGVTLKP